MPSTFETVANIIAETCDIPRDTITPESHAIDDLGIDSLDFLDIAFAIDKAFGIKLPLEQWTQEVNDGKATTEQYFVLKNLCARIDDLVAAKARNDVRGPMRIEYFQLIDRIIDLNLNDLTIRVEANVPTESTIFEGHFPGRPLMPGVLLIESMAQASGWLIIGRTGFAKMPFLAALKEVKLRTFVTPGQKLIVSAKIMHEGSGFAMTEAEIEVDGKTVCNADITFRVVDFPEGEFRRQHARGRAAHRLPDGERGPWLTPSATRHARPGSPASASCRVSARDRTRTGRRSALATAGRRHHLPALHHSQDRAARLRQADPEEGRSAPDGGVAAHRHLCGGARARLRRHQGQHRSAGAHRHDRRGRRRRARHRGRHRDPVRPARRREAGGLPQRTADERSAPDAVPGAALQPAGRQHLDRAWRHRLVAHLHGRGIRRRRCGPHRAVAHRGGPERHRAGRRQPQLPSGPTS